jgi:hypothetical protein
MFRYHLLISHLRQDAAIDARILKRTKTFVRCLDICSKPSVCLINIGQLRQGYTGTRMRRHSKPEFP